MPDQKSNSNERSFGAHSAYSLEDVRGAKREWSSRLLRPRRMAAARAFTASITPDPEWNVVGVGVGEKISEGRHTGVMAVKLLVRSKFPPNQIQTAHMLPSQVDGIPTDVEEVGLLRKFAAAVVSPASINPRTRIRPAQPGCSVGFADPSGQFRMAGTFGALAQDSAGLYILSNNHVLADENQLPAGAPIFQPGLLDGGDPSTDQIAALSRFIPLQAGAPNDVDCAIAGVLNPADVSNSILQIGPPAGTADAQIDMAVQKFGRTTGYAAGQVTSIDTDVTVQYETGTFMFQGQMIIVGMNGAPFSDAGDSGSLIVQRGTNLAVGLLFAGSSSHTIANHIGVVLTALNISLA
jgi:hypothetical protein